jgi:hypothetical protein
VPLMPIAAKLSRTLYDKFGSEGAEAMVDWMQRVETQRSELRELSDLGFARIDARFGEARAQSDLRFAEIREEMHTGFATLEKKIEQRFSDLIKWSFVFWVGSTVTLVVALAALARFVR